MPRLALRTDAIGYSVDGDQVDGFVDIPTLETADRLKVARWARAYTPAAVSPEQDTLLAEAAPRTVSRAQEELGENRERLAHLARHGGPWSLLSEEERRWVIRPFEHPLLGRDVDYPLSVGAVAALTGATERQIRLWVDAGLVHADRDGDTRRIYSAGVVQGLALARQNQAEKTVLARVLEGRESAFLDLLADALRTWSAGRSQAAKSRVALASESLVDVARLMVSESSTAEEASSSNQDPTETERSPSALGRLLAEALTSSDRSAVAFAVNAMFSPIEVDQSEGELPPIVTGGEHFPNGMSVLIQSSASPASLPTGVTVKILDASTAARLTEPAER